MGIRILKSQCLIQLVDDVTKSESEVADAMEFASLEVGGEVYVATGADHLPGIEPYAVYAVTPVVSLLVDTVFRDADGVDLDTLIEQDEDDEEDDGDDSGDEDPDGDDDEDEGEDGDGSN